VTQGPSARRFRPRAGLRVRQLGTEAVLLDRAGGRVHHLNATASFIFSALDGRLSLAEVTDRVVEHFDVEPSVAARDVAELVARLSADGILVDDAET
jgi:Coenzyme PQQ synthesis protein D (PqqD)